MIDVGSMEDASLRPKKSEPLGLLGSNKNMATLKVIPARIRSSQKIIGNASFN